MSRNNGLSSSRLTPTSSGGAWGGQGRQSNSLTASQEQYEAMPTDMTVNGGDKKQATQVSPSIATPLTNTNGRQPKGKKWAKLDLLDIAPQAGPSYLPFQQKRKPPPPFSPRHHKGPHRGINIEGESLSEIDDRVARLELKQANKPLTDFPPFSRLVPEIRFKICKFAAHGEARILELILHPDFPCPAPRTPETVAENVIDEMDFSGHNHRIFQVSKPGQKVPGVMHASRECRREGMLVFEKRYINSYPEAYPYADNDERSWTWYNPHRDIILFGEDTCIRTVVDFFHEKAKEEIQKQLLVDFESIRRGPSPQGNGRGGREHGAYGGHHRGGSQGGRGQ
ncbi:hypothetical protein MFRU_038g00350 [Monilinia fructicola]|nr:hypothetical protein MFRU_038g00350 [Monilinia fructicola]